MEEKVKDPSSIRHLPDDMLMYGPTVTFNTERKEEILCIPIGAILLYVVGIFLETSNLLVETLLEASQSKKA